MKNTNTSVWVALLAGLVLSACDKAPDSAAVQMPAVGDIHADAAPLDRHLDPAQVVRGRIIYEKSCAECHGVEGKGLPGDWRVRDAQGK